MSTRESESLRRAAQNAPRSSAEYAEAIRRLIALGDAESLRCVAECSRFGSAEKAEACRRLKALGE